MEEFNKGGDIWKEMCDCNIVFSLYNKGILVIWMEVRERVV